MLEHALAAKLPAIVVQTDDVINLKDVLQAYAGKPLVMALGKSPNFGLGKGIFYTLNQEDLTAKMVTDARDLERTVVYVNCKANNMAFDAGFLIPLDKTVDTLLDQFVEKSAIPECRQAMRGLSLKAIEEVLRITLARTGDLDPRQVRYTRSMLTPTGNGLYPVDTKVDFYQPSPDLASWVHKQGPYLMDPKLPSFMVPRGIMLAGSPGVGKTMGAKYIASTLGIPLYRLDIATSLTRWLGDAEARIASSLATLDKEEPCVVLLDEVEKVFKQGDSDNAAIERMLSQLLWWLQEHTSRVLVVMTTNNLSSIPPELYREGRLDLTLQMPMLSLQEATTLAHRMVKELVPGSGLVQVNKVSSAVSAISTNKFTFSHAEIRKLVVERIKEEGWKVKV